MNDNRLSALYRRALADRTPEGRAACPPPDELAALAEGALPEASRLALVDHAAACAGCSADLALLRTVAVAGEPAPGFRRQSLAGALAAGLLLALGAALVWRIASPGRDADILRGGARRVTLIAPEGAVSALAGRVLVWRPVAGASEYRVEIGRDGAAGFSAATGDTTLTLPDAFRLDPGADYEWSVDTRVDGERISAVGRFRVR